MHWKPSTAHIISIFEGSHVLHAIDLLCSSRTVLLSLCIAM